MHIPGKLNKVIRCVKVFLVAVGFRSCCTYPVYITHGIHNVIYACFSNVEEFSSSNYHTTHLLDIFCYISVVGEQNRINTDKCTCT